MHLAKFSALFYIINEMIFLSWLQALHLVEWDKPECKGSRQSFLTVAWISNNVTVAIFGLSCALLAVGTPLTVGDP